ncbi:ATP-dependent DNA helicase [Abeliophyllum distichum]|uniref:ATP-dependent DNA helicase n=1 Tax=Abeliophyllum distichum TaxID=126358 RepID=A0ABD1QVS3_9LAMI
MGECETWAICYVDLGLAMDDSVNTNDLVDEEFEEIEDVDLESKGVILEEWMLAASMGPMFDSAQQQMTHDLVLSSLLEERHIHMIISGGVGIGKSTLINAIAHSAFILFHSNKIVRIMAPTGVAAFNIGGATIHHELAISAKRKPSQPYIYISGDQCRWKQEDFKDTKLIIIDEYNMLGKAMLANIDLRCRNIFATNESFGGVSIILVGDVRQLPHVFDSPLYSNEGSFYATMWYTWVFCL